MKLKIKKDHKPTPEELVWVPCMIEEREGKKLIYVNPIDGWKDEHKFWSSKGVAYTDILDTLESIKDSLYEKDLSADYLNGVIEFYTLLKLRLKSNLPV